MRFKLFKIVVTGLFITMCNAANAGLLLVEQYDDYWSADVNLLINYANTNNASSSALWEVIDFTDDPAGFAGAIPGSSPWPSANGTNLGNSHPLNNTFFARITGEFFTNTADTYFFQTFNDDGVFVFIDGELVINDPNEHPETRFEGSKLLGVGSHSVELYFFENGGEASLEFSVADSSRVFTHFNDPLGATTLVAAVPEPSTLAIFALGLMGLASRRFKK